MQATFTSRICYLEGSKKYVKLHLKCNKGERRQDVTQALQDALEAYKEGITCANCGQPIWVIGSATCSDHYHI